GERDDRATGKPARRRPARGPNLPGAFPYHLAICAGIDAQSRSGVRTGAGELCAVRPTGKHQRGRQPRSLSQGHRKEPRARPCGQRPAAIRPVTGSARSRKQCAQGSRPAQSPRRSRVTSVVHSVVGRTSIGHPPHLSALAAG
ncbi:hypothetical protein LTR94_029043, partial [Friedmanniomyces endolithicus]